MEGAARDRDLSASIAERVRDAAARAAPLVVAGSASKRFLGNAVEGDTLSTAGHAGIVHYAPAELVVSVRAGTRIADLEATLDANGQMLAFEPPRFGADATVGGMTAAGLSGPRRANAGAVRDFVLGTRIVDGRGQVLRFGGEVIKNVAGYDLSRLMVGALGTLGVVLETSFRVVPKPRREETRVLEIDPASAIERVRAWALRPLPVSASAIVDGLLFVRFSGAASAVAAAADEIGGEAVDGATFWNELREQSLPFFSDARPLWRLSIAPASAPVDLDGPELIEWHGAQRWLKSDADPARVRARAAAAGGHATLFRAGAAGAPDDGVFQPLPPGLFALHQNLKRELDPERILNPGRLYPDL